MYTKGLLLESLANETERLVRFNTAYVVQQLSKHQLQQGGPGWPELLNFLEHASTSANPQHRELAMMLFTVLAESVGTHLRNDLASLAGLYKRNIEDVEHPLVRV